MQKWRRQTVIYKTWAQFQVDFNLAHKETCNDQLEADEFGYGGSDAAAIQGVEEVLANSAAATVSNRAAVLTLMMTNARLSQELANARVQIAMLTADLTALHLKVTHLEGATGNTGRNGRCGRGGRGKDAG